MIIMQRIFKDIQSFLEIKFNKPSNLLTKNDFSEVLELPINGYDIEFGKLNIKDILSNFPNIKSINFISCNLTNGDIRYLKSLALNRISFQRCSFEDINELKGFDLQTLIINNSKVTSFNFLDTGYENMEYLLLRPLDKLVDFDCDLLSNKNKIKQLTLENLSLRNLKVIERHLSVECLSLLGSSFKDEELTILGTIPKLRNLYIDKDFNNCEELSMLDSNVVIKNDYLDDMFYNDESEKRL